MTADLDRVGELNSLLKLFGIDGKVMFFERNALPFHLQGIFNGVHQGVSRGTVEEIEEFVQGLLNDGALPSNLGDELRASIAKRDAK